MQCVRCNAVFNHNLDFCPNCGYPVSRAGMNTAFASSASYNQQAAYLDNSPTLPTHPDMLPPSLRQPQGQLRLSANPSATPEMQPSPFQSLMQGYPAPMQQGGQAYNQFNAPPVTDMGYMAPMSNRQTARSARPRRRGKGCMAGCLVTLFLLLVLITGSWFLAIRPYVHDLAVSQVNNALTKAENQIPEQVALLPSPQPLTIQENSLNNLIVLNSAPSDTVKNMHISITPTDMQIDFQVYGLTSTITGVPQAQNGHLVMTNVSVQGIAALVMSPDDISSIINQHLATMQAKIKHSVTSLQLKNHEMDMVLGAQNNKS